MLERFSIVLLFIFLLTGCPGPDLKKDSDTFNLNWEISPSPVVKGPIEITLKLSDTQEKNLDQVLISAEGNMTHPGMVPVYSKGRPLGDGKYLIKMDLTMAGDWLIFLTLKFPEGKSLERIIELKGVANAP